MFVDPSPLNNKVARFAAYWLPSWLAANRRHRLLLISVERPVGGAAGSLRRSPGGLSHLMRPAPGIKSEVGLALLQTVVLLVGAGGAAALLAVHAAIISTTCAGSVIFRGLLGIHRSCIEAAAIS